MRAAQLAEMALLGGNVVDAESILLQNGLVFRAVMVNLHTHNWTRLVNNHIARKVYSLLADFLQKTNYWDSHPDAKLQSVIQNTIFFQTLFIYFT